MSVDQTPEPGAQRRWQAACPNCGAPVSFASAASAFAVCGFCRSTVVREGEALRRVGESAELFDDHTPLQLGASGKHQGASFTLIGRVQWRYAEGTWNEWHALFDSGKSGWLSEDNGRYVLSFEAPAPAEAPPLAQLLVGGPITLAGQRWSVASVQAAQIHAIQGELPQAPRAGSGWLVADLRNTRDEVATLEGPAGEAVAAAGAAGLKFSIGHAVSLSALSLTGLAADSEKSLRGRTVECPSCGASLEVKLSTTQSIACHQCHAVVDVSAPGGLGSDLQHYAQLNGEEPLIALGRTGSLDLLGKGPQPWQVVGYVERCEPPSFHEDDEDGQSFWREYLLYNRLEGFAFLIDAEDGWSWSAPITGVPEAAGQAVRYKGDLYRPLYSYRGKITYVLGEFYWKLSKGQTTANTDYAGNGKASGKRLNREQTGTGEQAEVVWSAGGALDADQVRRAFRIGPDAKARFQRDAQPSSLNAKSWLTQAAIYIGLLVLVLLLMRCTEEKKENCTPYAQQFGPSSAEYQQCLDRNRSGYRSSGGSWGGYSSGGGHK